MNNIILSFEQLINSNTSKKSWIGPDTGIPHVKEARGQGFFISFIFRKGWGVMKGTI